MFQTNILSSVYIDDYILIHGQRLDNYFQNSTLLMSITVIWQPPDVSIKAMNTAIINLADEGMIYEKYISTS